MDGGFRMHRSAVSGVETVEAATGRSFSRHTHEQFGIGLIHRGAQKSLSGRGMVEAEAGDVITVNPNEVHDGMPVGDARAWRILYFDPDMFLSLAAEAAEGSSMRFEIPHPVLRDGAIARRFQALFAAVTGKADAMRSEELLLGLTADILREGSEVEADQSLPSSVARARDLIDDDPSGDISLARMARESGLSRFQLVRAFSRATGLTPHAYLVQARVHLARRLIGGRMPLAEVAAASGFADQSHMTRAFTARYGLAPGVYARGRS